MTTENFEAILARQLPDKEKRLRADFIIDTEKGFADAKSQVRKIISTLRQKSVQGFGK